jgi:single-strand DNA-binding protein
MINKVILVGRITRDPEVKMINADTAVCNFSLACNRPYTRENGEREADFINCVAWRKQAENMGKFVKKGQLLGVEGRIQVRTYEQDGQKRYQTEVYCDQVTFLESSNREESSNNNKESFNYHNDHVVNEDDFFTSSKKLNISEDDLPF